MLAASAFLAYLGNEPGVVVADAIAGGATISTVNLGEALSLLAARGSDPADVASGLTDRGLLDGAIAVEPFTSTDAIEVADPGSREMIAAVQPLANVLRLAPPPADRCLKRVAERPGRSADLGPVACAGSRFREKADPAGPIGRRAERTTARTVTIAREQGSLRVTVADDGVGHANASDGPGLGGLADRLAALDGTLAVRSEPGAGTTLVAVIPCDS